MSRRLNLAQVGVATARRRGLEIAESASAGTWPNPRVRAPLEFLTKHLLRAKIGPGALREERSGRLVANRAPLSSGSWSVTEFGGQATLTPRAGRRIATGARGFLA